MPETIEIETPMLCRHVFTDGRRCAAACLRHEPFCYYHHTTRRPVQNLPARRRRSATFTLPELEDRAAIQLALGEILQRIASNDIDPKRAGHLLFGLQIATSLLPKPDPKDKTPPKTVSEITHDEELGDLAPVCKVGADRQPTEFERILETYIAMNTKPKPEAEPEPESTPKPFDLDTIPSLDAVASPDSELKPLNSKLLRKKPFVRRSTKLSVVAPPEKLLGRRRVRTPSTTPLRGHHAPQPTRPARRCPAVSPTRLLRAAARRRRPRLQ